MDDNTLKITDFGTAKSIKTSSNDDIAKNCLSIKGTPYYMAPEVLKRTGHNISADIWSLGCIFYEIATLNHAFDAQNMKGLVQKILKGTYPPLPEVYSSDFKKLLS